jgi:hypothetical protein
MPELASARHNLATSPTAKPPSQGAASPFELVETRCRPNVNPWLAGEEAESDVSMFLHAWSAGDQAVLEKLTLWCMKKSAIGA